MDVFSINSIFCNNSNDIIIRYSLISQESQEYCGNFVWYKWGFIDNTENISSVTWLGFQFLLISAAYEAVIVVMMTCIIPQSL